jgi:hypothetical protein
MTGSRKKSHGPYRPFLKVAAWSNDVEGSHVHPPIGSRRKYRPSPLQKRIVIFGSPLVFINLYMYRATVPIIRRNHCVFTTLGICYSVWMTGMQGVSTLHTRQSSTVISPGDGPIVVPKRVEIDKYTKNKLCTKLVLFTRLYRDAWSTKLKIHFW